MLTSSLVVFLGLGLGWRLYGNKSPKPEEPDALEKSAPWLWARLRDRLYVDEFYGVTVIAFYAWWARVADWLDRRVWGGIVAGVAWLFGLWAQLQSLARHRTGSTAASTKPAKSFRPAAACWRACRAAACRITCASWPSAVVALAAILFWSSRP